MNWLGDLIQKEVSTEDTVLDLGCGIMQATLDHIPAYLKTRLVCKQITGVDIYQPCLDFLNREYPEIETVKWDLRETPLPFLDKSHDVILLTDILEHLETYEQNQSLIHEAERIARKRVIILTPRIFVTNDENIEYNELGYNEYQKHHILVTEEDLRELGYKPQILNKALYAHKRLNLRILHLWDNAGVANIMAKYQRRLGHEVKVITHPNFDGLGINKFYNSTTPYKKPNPIKLIHSTNPLKPFFKKIVNILRSSKFYLMIFIETQRYNPDIIHIHSLPKALFLFPFRKKMLEFHGTDIRKKYCDETKNTKQKTSPRLFNLLKRLRIPIYFSTPDLVKDIPNSKINQWIPNPVDVEHFQRKEAPIPNTALYSWNDYEGKREAEKTAVNRGLALTILQRQHGEIMPYEKMPAYLEQFEYYIDRYNIPSLSKTALEALSMGLKVINWQGRILTTLDPCHEPESVVDRTLEIYRKVLA